MVVPGAARARTGSLTAAAAAATFVAFLLVLSQLSALYDADSYYHLAVAREYARSGWHHGLAWARFSTMSQGFGDKELLFHVLLAPLAASATTGGPGRLAIAIFAAAIAALLVRRAVRMIGAWGGLVPVLVFLGAADLTLRALRLRPELLSLLLLLLTLECAAGRRYRLLGVLAAVYTLSYTAFQTLPMLCGAWLLAGGLLRRRWDWDLVAYPLLGSAVGLFIHPQFPANIHVWILQNIAHHRYVLPDVGMEFGRNTLVDMLLLNGAWLLGLAAVWYAGEGTRDSTESSEPFLTYAIVAAVLFGGLFAILSRFATYFVPFATLAVLASMRSRARPYRIWVASLLAVAALGLAGRNLLVIRENLRLGGAFVADREPDAERFGRAVPAGARVAAAWAETEFYVFWAPQGRYLNVLDPIFMAAWRPDAYKAYLSLVGGTEPDIPLVVGTALESDYLAASLTRPFIPRLAMDPRLVALHRGHDVLYRLIEGANTAFVLDWKLAPVGAVPASTRPGEDWPAYPRAPARGQALEGFVDLARVGAGQACRTLVRAERMSAAARVEYRLAAYGTAELWIDGQQRLTAPATGAVLAAAASVSVDLASGPHVVSVTSCPSGRNGFYLVAQPAVP